MRWRRYNASSRVLQRRGRRVADTRSQPRPHPAGCPGPAGTSQPPHPSPPVHAAEPSRWHRRARQHIRKPRAGYAPARLHGHSHLEQTTVGVGPHLMRPGKTGAWKTGAMRWRHYDASSRVLRRRGRRVAGNRSQPCPHPAGCPGPAGTSQPPHPSPPVHAAEPSRWHRRARQHTRKPRAGYAPARLHERGHLE